MGRHDNQDEYCYCDNADTCGYPHEVVAYELWFVTAKGTPDRKATREAWGEYPGKMLTLDDVVIEVAEMAAFPTAVRDLKTGEVRTGAEVLEANPELARKWSE